jgi:hypothetical protein
MIVGRKGAAVYELDLLPTWKGQRVVNTARIKRYIAPAFPKQQKPATRPDLTVTSEG